VFHKSCLNQLERFATPMLRIPKRRPEAIPLNAIKSLEHEADRIELSLTGEAPEQQHRQTERRPAALVTLVEPSLR
jgi:hypothetical protein